LIFNFFKAFNHEFFWHSMTPNGGGAPPANSLIANQITKDFGSFEVFQRKFKDEGEKLTSQRDLFLSSVQ
jgi:Fe-Mn family superoxide dismutase